MARGNPDIARLGEKTRFTGESAVEAGRKGNAARRANIPVRRCLKNIATEALYGHPPLPGNQLQPVAKFFSIGIRDVTYAHLALYKQAVSMGNGDGDALNLVAAYAGEKPRENVSVTVGNYEALDDAFEALHDGAG